MSQNRNEVQNRTANTKTKLIYLFVFAGLFHFEFYFLSRHSTSPSSFFLFLFFHKLKTGQLFLPTLLFREVYVKAGWVDNQHCLKGPMTRFVVSL